MLSGVTKVKSRKTGETKNAIYMHSTRHNKLLYHVDGVAIPDRKFGKEYEIIRDTDKSEENESE